MIILPIYLEQFLYYIILFFSFLSTNPLYTYIVYIAISSYFIEVICPLFWSNILIIDLKGHSICIPFVVSFRVSVEDDVPSNNFNFNFNFNLIFNFWVSLLRSCKISLNFVECRRDLMELFTKVAFSKQFPDKVTWNWRNLRIMIPWNWRNLRIMIPWNFHLPDIVTRKLRNLWVRIPGYVFLNLRVSFPGNYY